MATRDEKKTREPKRTRDQGTKVHKPTTPEERIAAFREIVAEHQYAKIDGYMVDAFSASAVVLVYDAISPKHKESFASMDAARMASVAFKVINKADKG